jgi:hypothetical protein
VQTAETPEEGAHDQPEKTAIDAEYPLRSNDETLDEESRHQSRRKCHSRQGQLQPSAAPPHSASLSATPHYAPLRTEEITTAITRVRRS